MRVEMRGITKRFPGVVANDDVDLVVEPGQVHSLLGENGAGKSTLVNILFGLYDATEGEILVEGEPVTFADPAAAIEAGIGMVHQHFMLIPVFTVLENVMLGSEPVRGPFLDAAEARQRLQELSDRYNLPVDPDTLVEDLPVGVQQRVEILKALYRGARCLILDEPTAVLTPGEIDDFYRIVRSVTGEGHSVIFITHKLKEVLEISDVVTVLRDGRVVGTTTPAETDEEGLATMMVGRAVDLEVDKTAASPGDVVLAVEDLEVPDERGQLAVRGVTFDVRAGEILAVAGVQGNGQTELVRALTGLATPAGGRVLLGDDDVTGASPRHLVDLGVGHVPEDRQRDGFVGSFTVRDNLVLNTVRSRPWSRGIRIERAAVRRNAQRLVDAFDVRPPNPELLVENLSGGNQQKVIVAREFSREIRLLVAAQPTRGLDVGSIQYIHEQLVAKRDAGAAILLVSTELDEVMALGDRIAVMYGGRIVAILDAATATREQLGLLMAGAEPQEAA